MDHSTIDWLIDCCVFAVHRDVESICCVRCWFSGRLGSICHRYCHVLLANCCVLVLPMEIVMTTGHWRKGIMLLFDARRNAVGRYNLDGGDTFHLHKWYHPIHHGIMNASMAVDTSEHSHGPRQMWISWWLCLDYHNKNKYHQCWNSHMAGCDGFGGSCAASTQRWCGWRATMRWIMFWENKIIEINEPFHSPSYHPDHPLSSNIYYRWFDSGGTAIDAFEVTNETAKPK